MSGPPCSMNKDGKGEAASLQIEQCGPFLEDPIFEPLRATLPPAWLETQCECTEDDALSANMDNVTFHNDKFELVVNMMGYSPQEIHCNVTPYKIELIAQQQGKPERGTSGLIQRNRSMNRSYELPKNIDPSAVRSFLSSDGILALFAPWSQ